MLFNILADLGLTVLAVLILVQIAKSRRAKCKWDRKTALDRMWIGILAVGAVRIGGFILILKEGHGVGVLAIIQWVGIYWIALSVYRQKDLKRE
jgi:hypothetical protein